MGKKLIAIEQFTTVQAARISGFSPRQLDYWLTTGMLVPSVNQPHGSGTRKIYSFDDLVRLCFIKQLRQAGWSTQKIRTALNHLQKFTSGSLRPENIELIHDKSTILVLCETAEKQQILLDALNPGGQQVLWVVLEMLRDETRKSAIELLSKPSADDDSFDIAI